MAFFTPGQAPKEDSNRNLLLPKGSYISEIYKADLKLKEYGKLLTLTFKVLSPVEFNGHQVREYLCIEHTNKQTQDIANRKLDKICEAIDRVEPLEREQDLLGCTMRIDIDHRPDSREMGRVQEQVKYINKLMPADFNIIAKLPLLLEQKEEAEQKEFDQRKREERAAESSRNKMSARDNLVDDIPF